MFICLLFASTQVSRQFCFRITSIRLKYTQHRVHQSLHQLMKQTKKTSQTRMKCTRDDKNTLTHTFKHTRTIYTQTHKRQQATNTQSTRVVRLTAVCLCETRRSADGSKLIRKTNFQSETRARARLHAASCIRV